MLHIPDLILHTDLVAMEAIVVLQLLQAPALQPITLIQRLAQKLLTH